MNPPKKNLHLQFSAVSLSVTKMSSASLVIAILLMTSMGLGQPTEKILANLTSVTGAPLGGVILDAQGHIFVASYGQDFRNATTRGAAFELVLGPKGKWTKKMLYTFTGGNDGANPGAALIFDSAGHLYGTTIGGGTSGAGTVFELSPLPANQWSQKVLFSFSGQADGKTPSSALIFDQLGNLYGTTAAGGAFGKGTVFELSPMPDGTWIEKVLYSFTGGKDGSTPRASLIFDAAGNLYGTASNGGQTDNNCPGGCGTVFALIHKPFGNWNHKTLHVFSNYDGWAPLGGVIFDGSGGLFGTTFSGGTWGAGVLFRLTPGDNGTWSETILHSFCVQTDCGWNPAASLVSDAAGNLYGTTRGGGALGGTVFKFSPNGNGGWDETILHAFASSGDGWFPVASVTLDGAGNIYGTTSVGGKWPGTQGHGTVFEIIP